MATAILISALCAAGTTAALFLSGGGRAATVAVPVLVGLPEEEAKLAAEGAKLTLDVTDSQPDPVVRRGSVARQSPLAGERVQPGSRIRVTLSRGISVRLPNLVNLSRTAAERRLAALGLRVGEVRRERAGNLPEGTVIATEPPSGSSLSPDATVDLVLAHGTNPRRAADAAAPATRVAPAPGGPSVAVPKVTGVRLRFAEQRLKAAGLAVGRVSYESDEDHIEGYVLRQNPEPGANAPRGSAVDLTVNRE